MTNELYIKDIDEGVVLNIAVKPNSKKQVIDFNPNFLSISLKSSPEKGKANRELLKYLSKILDIPISKIQLISGHTSRDKRILISDFESTQIKEKLGSFIEK